MIEHDEPSHPLLELREISYSYPGAADAALDHVSLILRQGGHTGLIGPNGSGKTTLLHVIVGLLPKTGGSLLLHGHPMETEKDFRLLRREIGLLFQDADDQLFFPTVLEDVAFGPLNLGARPEEAKQTARQTLARLGLAGFEDRITHRLSGGEKKLVALATILAMRPRAILLDEPTNNLDPATRDNLIEILSGLDCATLIISHDWDFLAATCQDVVGMEGGKLATCDKACLHEHKHIHPYGGQPHRHGS